MNNNYTGHDKYKPYFLVAVILWAVFVTVVLIHGVKGETVVEPPVETIEPQIIEYEVEVVETEEIEEPLVYEINRSDVEMLARLAWGEARGCTTTEQAAVMWCVLNRVDAGFGDSIDDVITAPNQFYYKTSHVLDDKLMLLAEDVLYRWYKEKDIGISDGRVLPQGYCWFLGDGEHNHFRNAYKGGTIWDWSLPSPYEDD